MTPALDGMPAELPRTCPTVHLPTSRSLAPGGMVTASAMNTTLASSGWPGWPAKPKPTPPRELELAFDTEPIVGWRMWRIVDYRRHGGATERRLAPLAGRTLWHPRQRFSASCEPRTLYGRTHDGDHEAPWPSCMCGVWALRDRAAAEEKALERLPAGPHHACFGEVYLWGRVLEFKRGWRAAYAYPKRLILYAGPDAEWLRGELGRLYGVPVDIVSAPRTRPSEADQLNVAIRQGFGLPSGWAFQVLDPPKRRRPWDRLKKR